MARNTSGAGGGSDQQNSCFLSDCLLGQMVWGCQGHSSHLPHLHWLWLSSTEEPPAPSTTPGAAPTCLDHRVGEIEPCSLGSR